jgi:hypothetical protein
MLQKANLGFIGIGLCELNGWQDIESKTILLKNLPKINFRAAASGFTYSHIMVNSQPYNIGYISSLPFEVVHEYGPPLFQRYRILFISIVICNSYMKRVTSYIL